MQSKTILYSTENGFFSKEGFYLFKKPIYSIRYDKNILHINDKKIKTKNPFPLIEKILKKVKGYAVGFISYDFKENIHNLEKHYNDELYLPLLYINIYKSYQYYKDIKTSNYQNSIESVKYPDKKSFIENIKTAKRYIENGDIYQINLSHRIEVKGFFNIEKSFKKLAEFQPAPYLMLIKDKDFSLISASMELFLEKKGEYLTTKPIKGTRPIGETEEESSKFFNELKNSLKERAENLMITDLMRNDLARISEKGSVKVEKLFEIEKYKTLYQMSSTIKSHVKKNISLKEIIYNTFPPGSVTGAPKIRSMQIIDELEKYKRHVYCGATFVIKPNLDFIMSVAIRQSIFQKNKCFIYVGAGIVADSIPEKEYEETILKAKANMRILE